MSYWFSPSDLVTSCHPVCLPGGKDSRFPHFILRSSAAEQHHRESSHGSIWMMSLHVVCVSPSSLTGITHCMCVSMFDCHCWPSTGWNVNVLPSTHPQFTFLLTYSTFFPPHFIWICRFVSSSQFSEGRSSPLFSVPKVSWAMHCCVLCCSSLQHSQSFGNSICCSHGGFPEWCVWMLRGEHIQEVHRVEAVSQSETCTCRQAPKDFPTLKNEKQWWRCLWIDLQLAASKGCFSFQLQRIRLTLKKS